MKENSLELKNKSQSILMKRWNRFKSIKRAYYSFFIIIIMYISTWFSPFLVDNRAIMVDYEGKIYFPVFKKIFTNGIYSEKFFKQSDNNFGEADYRQLKIDSKKNKNGFVILPLYPINPYENFIKPGSIHPEKPTFSHILGTDIVGRDVFARLFHAFGVSMTYSLATLLVTYVLGILIGALFGYFGGLFDLVGQRILSIFGALEAGGLYLIIILKDFLKPTTVFGSIMILFSLNVVFGWIGTSGTVRMMYFRERSKEYTSAAVSIGASNFSIMYKHILPNTLVPLITSAPFLITGSINGLVSLDYLGFGLNPPAPSWGEILSQGQANPLTASWLLFAPVGAISLTLILITFVGEGIREAFDPKVFSRIR